VTRQRYEGVLTRAQPKTANGEDQESVNSGETALLDPFDNFRAQTLDPANLSEVTLDSGTYTQVPSRFASCGTLVSIYSHPNKSDVPGIAHPGHSNDTRFGNGGRPVFGALQQHINRENEKRRLRGHTRIRPGRQAWLENNEDRGIQEPRGNSQRGAQYRVGNSDGQSVSDQSTPITRSNSAQPPLGQGTNDQGLPSQSLSIPGYPMPIKVRLHPGQELANKLYEGHLHALQNRQAEEIARSSTRDVTFGADNVLGGMLGKNIGRQPLGVQNPLGGQEYVVHDAILNGTIGGTVGAQNIGLRGPVMQNASGGPLFYGAHMLGISSPLQSSMTVQDITNFQMKLAAQNNLGGQGPLGAQYTRYGEDIQDEKKWSRRRGRSRGLAQKADTEYGRYMDELNDESRSRGDTILTGDAMSGHARAQVRFNLQPPSPLPRSGPTQVKNEEKYDDDEDEEVEAEQDAWSNLMTGSIRLNGPAHHLNPAVFDPGTSSFVTPMQSCQHLPSATRPPTRSPNVAVHQTGRQSEPPRTRPVLLSPIQFQGRDIPNTPLDFNMLRGRLDAKDNRIFGELPGNISRDPSPGVGLQSSTSGRRLYEK
jgi:hypothetical protein